MIVNPMLFGGTKLPELENPGTAADLLAGKQLVDQYGNPLTGTMPKVDQAVLEVSIDSNGLITAKATQAAGYVEAGTKSATKQLAKKGASDLTASGAAVIVPAGYYPTPVSKNVATATQATPSISVSSNGLITASATQGAGYVSAGTKSATQQLNTHGGGSYWPKTYGQTIAEAGTYTTGRITVVGDGNLTAGNIRAGTSIFGVVGTFSGGKTVTKSDNTLTIDVGVTPAMGMSVTCINETSSWGMAQRISSFYLLPGSSVAYCYIFTGENSLIGNVYHPNLYRRTMYYSISGTKITLSDTYASPSVGAYLPSGTYVIGMP